MSQVEVAHDGSAIAEAWAAARAFTEARLEEIRQVEEEIEYMRGFLKLPVWTRILARETLALEALRRGMKGETEWMRI